MRTCEYTVIKGRLYGELYKVSRFASLPFFLSFRGIESDGDISVHLVAVETSRDRHFDCSL